MDEVDLGKDYLQNKGDGGIHLSTREASHYSRDDVHCNLGKVCAEVGHEHIVGGIKIDHVELVLLNSI